MLLLNRFKSHAIDAYTVLNDGTVALIWNCYELISCATSMVLKHDLRLTPAKKMFMNIKMRHLKVVLLNIFLRYEYIYA